MEHGPGRHISDANKVSFQTLKVPLQKCSLEICRAADGEDGVRALPCFHQGGDGLPQVQVVQVTGRHAFGRVHTSVDLHLQWKDADSGGGRGQQRLRMCDSNVGVISCPAQRGLRSLGVSLESYLVEFAGHLGVFLPQRLAEGQGTGGSDGQETRPRHQQLLTCPTCGTKMREGGVQTLGGHVPVPVNLSCPCHLL